MPWLDLPLAVRISASCSIIIISLYIFMTKWSVGDRLTDDIAGKTVFPLTINPLGGPLL